MTNPKDANQASEYIRNHISLSICHEAYSSEYEELTDIAKWTHDELVDEIIMPAINALIRTEKLKLLAEVRERAKEMYTPALRVNAVLISEIDKLEAEL